MLRKYSWLVILPLLGFLLVRSLSPAPGHAFGGQHLPFHVPEFPPLLRFSGLLLSPPPQEKEETKEAEDTPAIKPLAVTIGQEKWDFQLQEVKALSGGPNGPLLLSQIFPRQLRFIGPEKFLHQIEGSAKAGKFLVIEGHLYMGAYKFRVTGVGDNAESVVH